MAAQDDEVSIKRRRLFKALSAAPVVMTLRPGLALAQSSAYQCLTNIDQADATAFAPPTTGFSRGTICGKEENCFAYIPLDYWIVPQQPPVGCQNLAGQTIVEVETSNGFVYATLDDASVDVTDQVLRVAVDRTLRLLNENDPTELCLDVELEGTGYFLALGETVMAGPNPVFDPATVLPYPLRTQDGVSQGITQSCLLSVDPGAASFFTFVKG